jgi:flagellar biosynthesis/type III secretory pathway chaperone
MSRHISDLNAILVQLTAEHRKLLELMDAQHAAMKKFDLGAMADLMPRQEMVRLRIGELENKRRGVLRLITTSLNLPEGLQLKHLAELFPPQAPALLKSRQELREVVGKIAQRSQGSGRLVAAVLGHLNQVVRILASAAKQAGLYTRQGIPRVGTRLGAMDAVG